MQLRTCITVNSHGGYRCKPLARPLLSWRPMPACLASRACPPASSAV